MNFNVDLQMKIAYKSVCAETPVGMGYGTKPIANAAHELAGVDAIKNETKI